MVDSLTRTYPTGDLIFVDSVFYGVSSGSASGGIYGGGGLFRWNPVTNVSKLLNYSGGNGTPAYSGGKIYWLTANQLAPYILEYDIVQDTTIQYALPTYPGNGVWYGWYDYLCADNAYPKLLEVIPNQVPVLSNAPGNQTVCSNQSNNVTYDIYDADNDTMSFQISSSNPSLIPVSNISISNAAPVYTIHYSSLPVQTGTTIISVTANDGYGGSVNFSFQVTVNASPDIALTQNASTLTAQQGGATYQWMDCGTNAVIAGETNQSYTATQSGNYALIISMNNCTDTSACNAIVTAVIEESIMRNNLSIQPNPTQDNVLVSVSKNADALIHVVRIKNMLGEVLIEQKHISKPIDISALSNGVYFVCVETNSGNYSAKFVKN